MSIEHDLEYMPSTQEMGTLSFALANVEVFNQYIELRVNGIHSHEAFRRTFPYSWYESSNGFGRANAVEFNPYTISRLRDILATIDPASLWNPRLAVHEMLCLARDPYAKETARLGAMKELNVLLNITVVDEKGKTRAGRSLDDFYRDQSKRLNGDAGSAVDESEAQPEESKPITEEGAK